jgi:hypothetical protein
MTLPTVAFAVTDYRLTLLNTLKPFHTSFARNMATNAWPNVVETPIASLLAESTTHAELRTQPESTFQHQHLPQLHRLVAPARAQMVLCILVLGVLWQQALRIRALATKRTEDKLHWTWDAAMVLLLSLLVSSPDLRWLCKAVLGWSGGAMKNVRILFVHWI